MKNKKVFVALSGGVDSSVSAYLLKKQGYDLVGVYFKSYKPDGDITYCQKEGQSAQKVAEFLGIPFKVFDLQKEYKKYVFDYMINSYKKGKTPNPDIACNKHIKFGFFAKKAFLMGADYIATGHYSKIANKVFGLHICAKKASINPVGLCIPKDKNKDQTYFLSQINKDILDKVIFPLANYKKQEVRKLAQEIGLHTHNKKDSQGLCFIPQKVEVSDFLRNFLPIKMGELKNMQNQTIGRHDGAHFYTIAQRRGFYLDKKHQSPNQEALFVIKKNIKQNIVYVGTKAQLKKYYKNMSKIYIKNLNTFSDLHLNKIYNARIRHRGEFYPCVLQKDKKGYFVQFKKTPFAPSEGQFIAFYNNNVCLGSAEIEKIIHKEEK